MEKPSNPDMSFEAGTVLGKVDEEFCSPKEEQKLTAQLHGIIAVRTQEIQQKKNDVGKCQQSVTQFEPVTTAKNELDCKMIPLTGIGTHYLSELHQTSLLSAVQRILSLYHKYTSQSTGAAINDSYSQMQQCGETLTTLARNIPILNEDIVRLSTESLRFQNSLLSCQHEINQMKQVIDEKDSCITHISKTQETVKQELSSIRQKVEDLQSISYDGICTWKITNASEKMADAQSERQTSICSPPFYSSPTGYKMRMRLCLHGDGNARKTHLSLFFVLMRGDYDEILKWPFNFKVTFCLYDQSDQQRHIINSFRPDVTSNSFQRPKTQMNVEFGFPKFYPLPEMLQDGNNYMKDDTIFLKCLIDDRPKDILAYALRLNPGLPFHTQQELIQQSIEKRQEQQRQTLNYPLRNNMAPSPTSNDSAEWENHVSATDENVEEAICISRVYSVHSAATSTNLVDSSSNEET